jgi:hypothetical protein
MTRGLVPALALCLVTSAGAAITEKDLTSPATARCSRDGDFAGADALVRVALRLPAGAGEPRLRELRFRENSAPNTEVVLSDQSLNAPPPSGCPLPDLDEGETYAHGAFPWPAPLWRSVAYSVTAVVEYRQMDAAAPEGFSLVTAQRTLNVRRRDVLITGTVPSAPQLFIWDPANPTAPRVTLAAAARKSRTLRLHLYGSQAPPGGGPATFGLVRTYSQDVAFGAEGLTRSVPLNPPPAARRTAYSLLWEVSDADGDRDQNCSEALTISDLGIGMRRPTFTEAPQAARQLEARYRIMHAGQPQPIRAAAEAQVLSGVLETSVQNGLAGGKLTATAQFPEHTNTVSVPLTASPALTYLLGAAARDDQAPEDKAGRQRWSLTRFASRVFPLALNYEFVSYPWPPSKTADLGQHAAYRQAWLADETGFLPEVKSNRKAEDYLEDLRTRRPAVVFYYGHGGSELDGGNQFFQTLWDGTTWSYLCQNQFTQNWLKTTYFAKRPGVLSGPITVIGDVLPIAGDHEPEKLAANKKAFETIQVAVLLGCKTAAGADTAHGSPAGALVARGARSAIGFNQIIYPDLVAGAPRAGADTWATLFWAAVTSGDDPEKVDPAHPIRPSRNKDTGVKKAVEVDGGQSVREAALFASDQTTPHRRLQIPILVGQDTHFAPARRRPSP